MLLRKKKGGCYRWYFPAGTEEHEDSEFRQRKEGAVSQGCIQNIKYPSEHFALELTPREAPPDMDQSLKSIRNTCALENVVPFPCVLLL